MNGANAIIQCLRAEGAKVIFGYPGATIAPFYDALSSCGDIRHVLVRHEQNAGHAASGYARASGRPGVCCATSGPGAVNLLTALATAYMDSIPIIAVTGQVPTELLGRDVFQEADVTGAAEPFTKYCYLIKNADDIPRVFKEAFHIASTGRPGPVLIDIPSDIQMTELSREFVYPSGVDLPGYKPRAAGHPMQIKRAVAAISEAKRPVICTGGGVVSSGARKELCALAEKQDIPVVSTLMGVGAVPTGHRLYMGMLGSYGTNAAKLAVSNADLLILCGARVGDRTLASPSQTQAHAKIIHIDIDTVEIGKNLPADIPIVGDARLVLRELVSGCEEKRRDEWTQRVITLRERQENELARSSTEFRRNGVDPVGFMRKLSELVNRSSKAILTADVGQNQIWAANSFAFRGGRFLTSGGMGTMGYSVPAAIGAKLAKPSRQVIAVCGDGSFQMLMPELATIVQEGVAVKIIIMRNGCLGMVRQIQDRSYNGNRFSVDLGSKPDFLAVTRAYGIRCARVEKDADAEQAIKELLASTQPYVLECTVDGDEEC